MAIGLSALRELAGDAVFLRGLQYYQDNRVTFVGTEDESVHATVDGSNDAVYDTMIEFSTSAWDDIFDSYCNCPAYNPTTGMCKHVVATALAANAYRSPIARTDPTAKKLPKSKATQTKKKERATSRVGTELITHYAQKIFDENQPHPPVEAPVHIECILHYSGDTYRSFYYDEIFLTFKVGAKKLYVIKDIEEFVTEFRQRGTIRLGKNYVLPLEYDAFEPTSHALIDFILNKYGSHSGFYSNQKKALYLSRAAFDEFIDIVTGSQIIIDTYGKRQRNALVLDTPPALTVRLKPEPPGYVLSCSPFDEVMFGSRRCHVLIGRTLHCCSEDYSRACEALLDAFMSEGAQYYAASDVPLLLSSVIPSIKPFMQVEIDESAFGYLPSPLSARVYFDLNEDGAVLAHMTFAYGEEEFDAFGTKYAAKSLDLASEMKLENLISEYMGYRLAAPGTLMQDDEAMIYDLVSEGIDRLQEYAEIYTSDAFDGLTVHPPANVSVGVRVEGRLLEVDIDLEGIDFSELAEIINSYRRAKRYHRLRDGSFLALEDDALSQIAELGDTFVISDKALAEGHISLDINRALYLDALFKKADQLRYTRDGSFKEIVRRMSNIADAEFTIPAPLEGVLRNYQQTGYQWLRTLNQLNFGGILADDMGLGKTIQVLALFEALKEEAVETPAAAIVVCPASLVYNWQAEINRFTPDLDVRAVAGTASERAAMLAHTEGCDVMVTSYDLLKRDIAHYEDLHFSYAVLDEAQYIKNQNTQSAKAVKLLSADHRLALTGTPIENSLGELWSMFDFLMPGYLYSYRKFKQQFETAITKNKDEAAAGRLRDLVRPFILRRLKGDVLKELPDKIEQVQVAEMGDKQRKVYLATLAQTKKELSVKLDAAGAGQSRILVLAALTRLRQICCDPSLVFDNYDGESAKLALCMDLVHSCIESGHRVALFSQFTSMLDIIRKQLDAEKIEYYLLQGSTPKLERVKMVDKFNSDSVPVFLVSLKAGGTGLNLIGADVVIHYDPWWNMSAQNQATDRTHRIGQTKHVQVFRLIAKDTIEEKIIELQKAKADLADKIIQKGDNVFDTLSSEELVALLEG